MRKSKHYQSSSKEQEAHQLGQRGVKQDSVGEGASEMAFEGWLNFYSWQ